MVVFAVKKQVDAGHVQKHIDRISEVRNVPAEKLEGFKGMMVGTIAGQQAHETEAWCSNQLYIALGNLLTSAALLGIDACPMEGIERAKFDQILGLEAKGPQNADDCNAWIPGERRSFSQCAQGSIQG